MKVTPIECPYSPRTDVHPDSDDVEPTEYGHSTCLPPPAPRTDAAEEISQGWDGPGRCR
ncbi:hypothetical protein [Nonomuraea sp. JJY05]|jgi:hypothetical protein|uniref:hypothetical protein n=1 Tax=Nonomuraea sp. JJY05 TaxID=3350255 RepID=UPI00373FB800